jgi:hypothetical protein
MIIRNHKNIIFGARHAAVSVPHKQNILHAG